MAGETVTTATTMNDVVYAAIITDRVLRELRPYNVMRPWFRVGEAGPSKVYQFPVQDDVVLADALVEADDYTTDTAITTSNAQVTAAEIGLMTSVSDFLVKVSIIDTMPHVSAILARSLAERFETSSVALLDDGSATTTAAGTLTTQDFLRTVAALEAADVTGPLGAVLHPKQAGELRAEIAATTAVLHTSGNATGGLVGTHLEGDVGTLFGIPIRQTSLVVSSGGLREGAVYVIGEAMGLYEVWGPRVELQRDASARSTEVVATQCFGVGTISASRIQGLSSAA